MQSYLARANYCIECRRWKLAIQELHALLPLHRDDDQVHYLIAYCLKQLREYRDAETAVRQALALHPKSPQLLNLLAILLVLRNAYPAADEVLCESLALDAENCYTFGVLAYLKIRRRNFAGALADCERGLAVDPTDPYCLLQRAHCLRNTARSREAVTAVKQLLRRDPENAEAFALLGWLRIASCHPRRAVKSFRESLRIDPNDEWAQLGLTKAKQLRRESKSDKAAASADQGWQALAEGDADRAVDRFRVALKADAGNEQLRDGLLKALKARLSARLETGAVTAFGRLPLLVRAMTGGLLVLVPVVGYAILWGLIDKFSRTAPLTILMFLFLLVCAGPLALNLLQFRDPELREVLPAVALPRARLQLGLIVSACVACFVALWLPGGLHHVTLGWSINVAVCAIPLGMKLKPDTKLTSTTTNRALIQVLPFTLLPLVAWTAYYAVTGIDSLAISDLHIWMWGLLIFTPPMTVSALTYCCARQ